LWNRRSKALAAQSKAPIVHCGSLADTLIQSDLEMFFGGFSSFAWQRGTFELIAIHLITLHHILEYMQIAIIQTEAADLVKIHICVILKTFGQDCTYGRAMSEQYGLRYSTLV
jgi:hypothetical protein